MGLSGRWASTALLLALLALSLGAFAGVGPLDDDFVFYRYAEGILERGEIAWHPGERVEGFVAPLWLAALTAAMALGVEPWVASRTLGLAAAVGVVLGAAWLARRLAPGRFPWPAALLAGLPALGFWAHSGLGTSAAAGALVAFAVAWKRALEREGPARGAALWLGAASLLRPETLLFAPPFVLAEAGRSRARGALLALAPLGLWTAFRRAYFGTWLPHPFFVKRLGPAEDLAYGLEYLAGSTLEVGAGAWLVAAAVLLARRAADRFARALLLGFVLHALGVVAVGGDYMRFARLFLPALPLGVVVVTSTLLAERASASRLRAGLVAVLLLLPLGSWHMARGAAELHRDQEGRWRAVGEHLATALPADYSIALSPIGCIGYLARRPVVDLLGLTHRGLVDVTPDLRVRIKGHHRFDARWALEQDPHCVLPSNARLRLEEQFYLLWERDLLVHPEFTARYRPVSLPIPGSYPLVLYLRRDLELPPGARPV